MGEVRGGLRRQDAALPAQREADFAVRWCTAAPQGLQQHREHRLLARQFRQPAQTTTVAPSNHQTAKYANDAKEFFRNTHLCALRVCAVDQLRAGYPARPHGLRPQIRSAKSETNPKAEKSENQNGHWPQPAARGTDAP